MPSGRTSRPPPSGSRSIRPASRRTAGFTLAETLAALLLVAIVIPVALRGIQLATYAGVVSQRKQAAARIGDNILAESLAATSGSTLGTSGTIIEDAVTYRWQILSESWTDSSMRRLTVEVFFDVQGREHDVRLATLASPTSL